MGLILYNIVGFIGAGLYLMQIQSQESHVLFVIFKDQHYVQLRVVFFISLYILCKACSNAVLQLNKLICKHYGG